MLVDGTYIPAKLVRPKKTVAGGAGQNMSVTRVTRKGQHFFNQKIKLKNKNVLTMKTCECLI